MKTLICVLFWIALHRVHGQVGFQQVRPSGFSSLLPPWNQVDGGNTSPFSQFPTLGQRTGQGGVSPLATVRGALTPQGGATVSEIRDTFNGRFDFGFIPEQLLPRNPVSDFVPVNRDGTVNDPAAFNSLASLPPNTEIPFDRGVEFQRDGGMRVDPRNAGLLDVNRPIVRQVGPIPTIGPVGDGTTLRIDGRDLSNLLDRQHSAVLFGRRDIHNGPHTLHGPDVHHRSEIHHGSEIHPRNNLNRGLDMHLRLGHVQVPEIHHQNDGHEKEIRIAMQENKMIKKQIKQELKNRKQKRKHNKRLGIHTGPTSEDHHLQDALQKTKAINKQLKGALQHHKHTARDKKIKIIDPSPPLPPPPPPPPPPKKPKRNPLHALAKGLLVGGLGAMLLGK